MEVNTRLGRPSGDRPALLVEPRNHEGQPSLDFHAISVVLFFRQKLAKVPCFCL
jgi:hypothetical protein